MGAADPVDKQIILFDGVCNLCNASVQFIIKRDRKKLFRFASLQSEYASKYVPDHKSDFQSLVLIKNDQTLTKSTAALSIARHLSGGWPLLYIFIVIPVFLRDSIYTLIARNRYRWFGKMDECMLPSSDLKSRFIESAD